MAPVVALVLLLDRVVSQPLRVMTRGMVDLVGGDRDLALPYRDRRDEIGAMARSLQVFKENARELAIMRDKAEDASLGVAEPETAIEETGRWLQAAA